MLHAFRRNQERLEHKSEKKQCHHYRPQQRSGRFGQGGQMQPDSPRRRRHHPPHRAKRMIRGFVLKRLRLLVRGLMRDLAGDLDGNAHCAACSSSAEVPADRSSSVGWRTFIVSFCPVSSSTVAPTARRANARRAASCSASFLVLPKPLASDFPGSPLPAFNRTSTRNRLRWSGPLSLLIL